jgi:hypothetical protein
VVASRKSLRYNLSRDKLAVEVPEVQALPIRVRTSAAVALRGAGGGVKAVVAAILADLR